MKSDERYTLELVGLPGWSTPTAQRVKRLLKAAGRQFGLRCVHVVQIRAQEPARRPSGDCQGAVDHSSESN